MKPSTSFAIALTLLIPFWIFDFRFSILTNSNVAKINQNGIATADGVVPIQVESVVQRAVADSTLEESTTRPGLIVTAGGQVELKRRGWLNYRLVGVGTPLYRGDILWPKEGARVVVRCGNGRNSTLPAGVPSGVSNYCPLPPKGNIIITPPRQGEDSRIASDIPYIISPRNTAVLNDKPTLRWNAVRGATAYTVRVSGPGVDWERTVSTPEVVYPGEPPLEPGGEYSLIIEVNNRNASAKANFRRLEADEAQQVQAQAQQIPPEWTKEAKALILADLYNQYDLIDEAIERLEVLVNQGSQIPSVYYTLGNLYLQVGLTPVALERYLKAVELATKANDLAGQIAAQQGLINLAHSYIVNKKYAAAEELLTQNLEWAQEDKVKYNRLTYLGWVRLEQSRLEEAQTYLKNAIDQDSKPGLAYCLLASVLEAKGDSTGTQEAQKNCQEPIAQTDEKSVKEER
jgi:predicted negative regulator of RcsB-dependent stress response